VIPEQFEDELRAALRREAVPADFAACVMARIPRKRRHLPWALAAALALGAAIPIAVHEQRRVREASAQEAKRKLITALDITRAKIRHTRESIHRRASRI
jgi:hypothetical protein